MQNLQLNYVNSCFNYTGNKYKQLSQLFHLFPDSTDAFVDIFCGGGVVGLNAINQMYAQQLILNDKSSALISIFDYLKKRTFNEVQTEIFSIIDDYELTNTSKYGYKYYGANSSKGLAQVNKSGFLKLRSDFNHYQQNFKYPKEILLYVLIIFSFNNQIRFNKQGEFNLPIGKRDFNRLMQQKLANFMELLSRPNIKLNNQDFTEVQIPNNSFVYCDPPYSITTATYNERNLWTSKDDLRLFEFLDALNNKNIKFALSNVITHNGLTNKDLKEWSEQYHVHPINFNYNNSNYHSAVKNYITQEVLITNY